MSARDFIENELSLWLSKKRKQADTNEIPAFMAVEDFILNNRHKWDKPEQGVVDEEAQEKALIWAMFNATTTSDDVRGIIQSYEKAKLDKLTGKTDSAKPSQGVGGHDDTLSGAGDSQPMPIKQELSPLPEKLYPAGSITEIVQIKGHDLATFTETMKQGKVINALIDWAQSVNAALYKRGK